MLRWRFALSLLLVLPSATLNLHAQDIAGQWQGTDRTITSYSWFEGDRPVRHLF